MYKAMKVLAIAALIITIAGAGAVLYGVNTLEPVVEQTSVQITPAAQAQDIFDSALAVAQYCFGPEMTQLSSQEKKMLESILTANGRSFADPVYMPDGRTVDMESSRRVVFKFRMKDAEMIDQMSEILEGQQGD